MAIKKYCESMIKNAEFGLKLSRPVHRISGAFAQHPDVFFYEKMRETYNNLLVSQLEMRTFNNDPLPKSSMFYEKKL